MVRTVISSFLAGVLMSAYLTLAIEALRDEQSGGAN